MDSSFTVVDQLRRGRKAERVALMDNPWPETVRDWVQQGYPMRAAPVQSRWASTSGGATTAAGRRSRRLCLWAIRAAAR